jgi:eukaryotic-like serine/threonine-protein kinase
MTLQNQAAHYLTGLTLDGGWRVIKKLERESNASGGYFSVCYIVENDSEKAFLKALNISAFFDVMDDLVDTMQKMTKAFQHERDLLLRCQGHKLSNIISLYEFGQVKVEGDFLVKDVPYLIFELAEGDIREKIEFSRKIDIAWKLNSIHDVAVGIKQLHGIEIAHLDINASNIFAKSNNTCKVGDLGRSLCEHTISPHDDHPFPGNRTYAPPEIFYGFMIADKKRKMYSIDCYLLGSLITFYFLGTNMTALIKRYLDKNFVWDTWKGDYAHVLPYLVEAFGHALNALESSIVDKSLRLDIRSLVECLCQPDPYRRGHPKTILSSNPNQYDLERIVARLSVLKLKAEYRLIKT